MREVQATDAKTRMAELLRAVEFGETIAITRHGRTVAHLVPVPVQDRASRGKSVKRFRQRRDGWELAEFSTDEILEARHVGHRL